MNSIRKDKKRKPFRIFFSQKNYHNTKNYSLAILEHIKFIGMEQVQKHPEKDVFAMTFKTAYTSLSSAEQASLRNDYKFAIGHELSDGDFFILMVIIITKQLDQGNLPIKIYKGKNVNNYRAELTKIKKKQADKKKLRKQKIIGEAYHRDIFFALLYPS